MNKPTLAMAAVLIVMASSCAPPKNQNPSTLGNKADVRRSNRAKLIVQEEKNGTETGVYQQDLKLTTPITVNGKPIAGKHSLEIGSTGNFPANKPGCYPTKTSMIILHEKPKKDGWQFPKNAKIVWVIDGKMTSPKKVIESPIELEDGKWWESLITEPECETFKQFGTAKDAELRINDAVIRLSAEEIATIKEFTSVLGY